IAGPSLVPPNGPALLRPAETSTLDPKTPIFPTPFESLQKSRFKSKGGSAVKKRSSFWNRSRGGCGSVRPSKRGSSAKQHGRALRVESLEDRRLLTILTWTGAQSNVWDLSSFNWAAGG
ncbi:MAG: hypothetical protein ABSF26_28370, partial [Thermoguttaceae bacterium]